MSIDAVRVAAALRVLADAIEGTPETAGTPAAAAGQPAKRGRGRPVTGEAAPATTTAPAAAPAATEPDPFDTAPAAAAAPTATLDEVRDALKALSAATTQAGALKLLNDVAGVPNLTDLQKTPEKYGLVVQAAKKATPAPVAAPAAEADPFETSAPAAAPVVAAAQEQKAYSKEDVKKALIKAQQRTAVDTVQAVVMKHGGKAPGANGVLAASLNALPVSAYGLVVAEVEALPTTKTA